MWCGDHKVTMVIWKSSNSIITCIGIKSSPCISANPVQNAILVKIRHSSKVQRRLELSCNLHKVKGLSLEVVPLLSNLSVREEGFLNNVNLAKIVFSV